MGAIHQVLKRYSIHNVNIKLSKCHFVCHRTEFLGHEVEIGSGQDWKVLNTDPEGGGGYGCQTM